MSAFSDFSKVWRARNGERVAPGRLALQDIPPQRSGVEGRAMGWAHRGSPGG